MICTFTKSDHAAINAASIQSPMRCHLAGCGTPSRMMPSPTQSFTVDHMMRVIRVYDEVGHVIETHEHAGEFREW